jgi:hypothetical protein
MDYCNGSPDYASGGFIADSIFAGGTVTNGSQQQYMTRDSSLDGWSNPVWSQVFCGDPGAPAQSFAGNSGDSGGPSSYTTLATCPVTEEEPYLYQDSSGNYDVFVPSLRTNSSGPSWSATSNTPGTSLSVNNTFYIVNSSSTVTQINAALAAGDNLRFTPGVYSYASTINVTNSNTKIIGLGFPTLIPTAGNITMNVADVSGVNISGMIFDAGPTSSPALLQVGTQGSTVSHASDPVTIDDVFFRVGGAETGTAATSFIDNSNNSIIDDVWAWRADHGSGAGSWTSDQGNTGLIVNGNDVTAYGLAVEHYQQDEVIWNGQGGEVIFFQNGVRGRECCLLARQSEDLVRPGWHARTGLRFVGSNVAANHEPRPHNLPLGMVGPPPAVSAITAQLDRRAPGAFAVRHVARQRLPSCTAASTARSDPDLHRYCW